MKNNWPYYKQIKTEKYLKKKVHTEIWHQRGSLLALCVFVALKHSESSFKMDSIFGHCEPLRPDLRTSSPLENCEISRPSHFRVPLTLENRKNSKWKGLVRVCRNFLSNLWKLIFVVCDSSGSFHILHDLQWAKKLKQCRLLNFQYSQGNPK